MIFWCGFFCEYNQRGFSIVYHMESKKHVGQQKDIWNTQTQKFYNFGEGTFTPQQNGTKFALYT